MRRIIRMIPMFDVSHQLMGELSVAATVVLRNHSYAVEVRSVGLGRGKYALEFDVGETNADRLVTLASQRLIPGDWEIKQIIRIVP